jgi:adenosylmethionine-8-amino-7-oxononanoate aminotransferase
VKVVLGLYSLSQQQNNNKMTHIKEGEKHIWLPYTQMQNHLPQLEVSHTKGSEIFLKDGRVLIDGIASWWSVAHGYNHPHITREMIKQLKTLPHVMLAGLANEQTYKLAHRLCKFSEMDHVFFSDSGSTAVEVAMKVAWQFRINRGEKNKNKFISFKNSYHGDTTGAMSLADLTSGMHQKFQNILIENFSLKLPQNKNDLNEFEDFIKKNQNILAGVFIEPIVQCAGSMTFHSPEILREIFNITKKYNILFIADECATGFYRTGKKFAVNHANIKPDIMIVGKALTGGFITLAATLVSKEIYKSFLSNSLDNALMHGPTFMGNPLACSAANASLDLFEKENYEEKIKQDEKFMRKKLEKHSFFKNTRVIGMLGVVEHNFSFDEILNLRKNFINKGVFLRPFSNCIYLMPALNIKRKHLQTLVDAI